MKLTFLDGYKTHITVFLGVATLIAVNLLGFDIPGVAPSENWLTQVLGLLGFSTVRAGVKAAAEANK